MIFCLFMSLNWCRIDPSKRRRVKHLTGVELERKRARDRHAQHARRQKLAHYIEELEERVARHEETRIQARQRNQELETTLSQLRAECATQLSAKGTSANERVPVQEGRVVTNTTAQTHGSAVIRTANLLDRHTSSAHESSSHSHFPSLGNSTPQSHFLLPSRSYITTTAPLPTSLTQSVYPGMHALAATVHSQASPGIEIYHGPSVSSPGNQPISTPLVNPNSTSLPSAARTPSVRSEPLFTFPSSCWQNQPSVYAWQIPVKLSTPNNPVDEIVLGLIQAQRHLARTSNITGEALTGPIMPDLNVLFGRVSPDRAHPLPAMLSSMFHELSSTVANFHDRVGGFLATYRLYQWMIDPTKTTYERLFDWQAPRPSQLIRSHQPWMDTPAWGKFKDMIIENQETYDTFEFQYDYLSGILLEWPFEPMDAVCMDKERMIPSPLLEKQLSIQSNIYMSKAFAKKYPEFAGVCRFEELGDE